MPSASLAADLRTAAKPIAMIPMLHLRPMTAADVPFGMHLKRQAGWNQLETDWLRCLDLEPEGCFVAEWDGTPAGTTTTCIFDTVAWVAMILVEESLRGRGIGSALQRHALAFFDRRGVCSAWLDATPLGQPVYEKLGFVAEFPLARWTGIPTPGPAPPEVEPMRPEDMDAALDLDRKIAGTDRRKLLMRVFEEGPEFARVVRRAGKLTGFTMARRGENPIQLGPCLGEPEAGELLLADAFHRFAGQRLYADVPLANTRASILLERQGFQIQRPLLRMRRGRSLVLATENLWTCFGAEKG